MTPDREPPATPVRRIALLLILGVAAAARLTYLNAGVPFAVGIDEPIVVDHAVRILRTGEWNPHVFNYPSLVIYVHAWVDIARFLWGALRGEWSSLDGFSVAAIYQAARLTTVVVGTATVWLTYKVGLELASRDVALLAAAQMAVRPMHVRESHFALTDVPMTALVLLAIWLTLLASRRGSVRAYAWAGAACGLAAAAKYTGGVVFAAVLAAWIVHERRSRDAALKIGAAAAAAGLAFLAGAPYTLLDLPSFLDGFASLFAQFAGPWRASDPAWMVYAKHLWIDGPLMLTLAMTAIPIVLARRSVRWRWIPVLAFAAAYFYVLSSHTHVFGRYALPLLPVACLLSSVAIFELPGLAARVRGLDRPLVRQTILTIVVVVVLFAPLATTVRWLGAYKRPDTRTIAAEWLKGNAPKNARVAVENSGPTYLAAAAFAVAQTELLTDHDLAWYRENVDYLIVSATDLASYHDILAAGPTVFQISPTLQRWGPPIRIVKLRN